MSVHRQDIDKLHPAKVRYDGKVTWDFPAIFYTTCPLDVTYFPYDQQQCRLEFSSWTYDISKLDIYNRSNSGVDDFYYEDGEWNLMGVPVERLVYDSSSESYVMLIYTVKLERKPLYYVFNLLMPCFSFTFCGILVFLLPPDCGEKVSMSVTMLLSSTVFLVVVAGNIPVQSDVIPLMGKYLFLTSETWHTEMHSAIIFLHITGILS